MFVKNFFELLKFSASLTLLAGSDRNLSAYPTSAKSLTNTSVQYLFGGKINSANFSYLSQNVMWAAINSNYAPFKDWSVIVGSSDVAPTANDIALGNDITSSFSSVSSGVTISTNDDGELVVSIIWGGSNHSGADLTINEIGITKTLYGVNTATPWAATSLTATQYVCLMAHEKLTTPVVVADGSDVTLAIQIVIE